MNLAEEVVNHDLGDPVHTFTMIIQDSIELVVEVSPVWLGAAYGISAADQVKIIDTIKIIAEGYPDRVGADTLAEDAIIGFHLYEWELNTEAGVLSLSGNLILGYYEEPYLNFSWDCYTTAEAYFDSTSYWEWAWDWGGCNGNPATSSDAAKEMTKFLNYRIHQGGCPNACNPDNHFKNITFKDFNADDYVNPNDPNPGDHYMDYLLWYEEVPNQWQWPNTCLDQDEMIFHTNGAYTIAENNRPNGKVVIAYSIGPTLISGSYPYPIMHYLYVWYGTCDN